MAIQQIASFMTSDGKTFADHAEAKIHEASLEMDEGIQAIAEKYEIPSRTLSTLQKWLPIFITELDYIKAQPSVSFKEEEATEEEAV